MIKIRNWGTSSSISYLFRPLKIKSRQSWRVIASRHYRFIIKHLSKWIINLKVAPAPTAAVSLVKKTASCWLRGCFSVNSRDVVCFLCRYRAAGWRPRSWNLTPRSQISPLPASSDVRIHSDRNRGRASTTALSPTFSLHCRCRRLQLLSLKHITQKDALSS